MSIVLECDAPGCTNTTKASVKENSHVLLYESHWWVNPGFGRTVVGCSERCINAAVQSGAGVKAKITAPP